ncbi:SDR family NAD(P)-dependent oxidoreductase [Marinomonas epiphytica]
MSSRSVVWITGASSGIGLSLVEQYLDLGWRVIASARSVGQLQPLLDEHEYLDFVAFDVTRDADIISARLSLMSHTQHLDCVILNAGTCEYFNLHDSSPDWAMMQRVMSVNFFGVLNSIQLSLPLLQHATRPHLVAIGSQAVQAPFPQAQAYGSSKAALQYFMSSMRMDLKPLGIDVTTILPGFVDTPLTQKNDFVMPFLMSTNKAAGLIAKALTTRPYEFAFPRRLSVMLWFARQFPKLWQSMLAPKGVKG